jgi:hypothetical protein
MILGDVINMGYTGITSWQGYNLWLGYTRYTFGIVIPRA